MSDANANISVSIDTSAALAQLKELQRQISLFHTNVTRSTTAAAQAQQSLQKSLIDDINATGKFAASLTRIRTSTESFTDSLEKNKFSMREYFRYAGASTKTFSRLFRSEFDTISRVAEERVKTLQTQYIKLGRDASGALQSIAVRPLTLDMKDYGTQTALTAQKQALFNQLMKQGSTNLLNFGKNTQWAGRQLMVGFTIPLTMLGSTASKVFMDMEAQAIKFKKVYGDLFTPQAETQQALDNVKELGKMFTRYGVAITDTMGIAAEAAAAGFQGADLMRQTREATRLSVLGEIDRQQALKTTMALQNAFGLSSDQLAEKINFLNAVENQTVTSLDDITQAIPRVAPVIKQLGGDVEDLAYFLTAMKEGGVNAAEGANALKSGLASIINPTGKAAAMFEKLNINVQDIVTKNKGNLKGTIQEFAMALDDLDPLNRAQALEQLFGKFQLARVSALFANIAKQGSQASKVLGIAGTSIEDLAATADSELGLIEQSTSTKFKAAVENLKISIAPIGEEFLKAVTPIVEFFGNIADKFNNLSDRSKRIITIIVGLVGAIGPVFLMTFGLLANGIANIIKLFMTLRGGFQRITGQSNILTEQTQYLTEAQAQAAAVAHSLDQTHANLIQTFNIEAGALENLARVYERADRAGMSFAARNPLSMSPGFPQPRKYAKGVVSVPGPKGAGDVVPAMLSPGESVIPAKQSQKYGSLIQGIVADNIPGYAKSNVETGIQETLRGVFVSSRFIPKRKGRSQTAGERAQVNAPNAYELGHFSEGIKVTGEELRAIVENESKKLQITVEELINSTENGLEQLFRIFTNEVTVQSKELNQALGEVGSGRVADKALFEKEAVRQAEVYNAPLIAKMKDAGAAPETISNAVSRLSSEFEQGIKNLGDKATVTAEEVNAITEQAYRIVSDEIEQVKIARESMRSFGAVRRPGSEERVSFRGGYNTSAQKKKVNQVIQEQNPNIYPAKQAFVFTGPVAREVGIQNAEALSQIFDKLDKDAKIRVGKLVGDVKAMSKQVVEEAKRAGINIGEYLVLGIAKGTESASPSRAAKREGKNVVDGLNQGMKEGIDDVTTTGQNLGQAATTGVTTGVRRGRRGVTTAGRNITPGSDVGLVATSAPMVVPVAAPLVIRETTKDQLETQAIQRKNNQAVAESTRNYNQYNSKLAGASFALSSLSGIGMMFGGSLGELSQKVFGLSSALFALQTITQLVTREKFTELIATRASIASKAMDAAATGGGILAARGGVKGILPLLGRFALGITKFIGPIGWITTAVTIAGFAFSKYRESQERARKELEAFSIAAKNSKESIDAYGSIFGVTPGKLLSETSNPTVVRQDKRSQIDQIRGNAKFIESEKQTIETWKTLSQQDLLAAISTKGLELRARGFADAQIQAILAALKEESGRTDINLDFNKMKFTEKTLSGMKKTVTTLAKDLNKTMEIEFANYDYRQKNMVIDPEVNPIIGNAKTQAQIDAFTTLVSQNINSIGTLLQQGVIDVKKYNSAWNDIQSSINALNPRVKELAVNLMLQNSLKTLNPELAKLVDNLGNAEQKTLMLQLVSFGLIDQTKTYATAIETRNRVVKTYGENTLAAVRAELALVAVQNQSKEALKGMQNVLDSLAKQYKAYQDNLNKTSKFSLKKTLEEQIALIKNQTTALQKLAKAGVDAETALDIINNPEAAAAITKAQGATLEGYVKQLKSLSKVTDIFENLKDAFKPASEIFGEQLDRAKNLLDYQKFVYDLQFDKQIKLDELTTAQNDYALAQIAQKEKLVEDSYNKQFEALDELTRKQEEFNQLQQGKFSLAQALAQGDMAGAASAIQNIRDQEAKAQLDRRRQLLEQRKEEELAAIKVGDKTRTELEKENDLIALRKQRIDLQKQEFAAQQTALNMTRDEIDNAIEALDLARSAKINVNSKTFLKNVMSAVKGDASALSTSVDQASLSLNKYIDTINQTRKGIEQTVIDVANLAEKAQAAINVINQKKQESGGVGSVQTGIMVGGQRINLPQPAQPRTPTYISDGETQYPIEDFRNRLRDLGIRFNSGGNVKGPGTSTSDSIPALLSDGEYVVRASSVDKYGVGLFEQLNAGKFAQGGAVGSVGALGNFINEGMGSFFNSKPVQTVGQISKSLTVDPIVSLLQSFGRVLDPRKAFKQDTRSFTEQLSQATSDALNIGLLGMGSKANAIGSSLSSLNAKQVDNISSYIWDTSTIPVGSSAERLLHATLGKFNVDSSVGPLYRGTKTDLSSLEIGDVYKRPRRTSTTADIDRSGIFANGPTPGTILKILPNKNTKGISIPDIAKIFPGEGLDKYLKESEVLLAPGNFKVVGKEYENIREFLDKKSKVLVPSVDPKVLMLTLEQIKRSRLENFVSTIKNRMQFISNRKNAKYLDYDAIAPIPTENKMDTKISADLDAFIKDLTNRNKKSNGGLIQRFARGGAVDLVNPGTGKSSNNNLLTGAKTVGTAAAIAALASKAPAILSSIQNFATAPTSPTAAAAKAGAVYMGLEQGEKYLSLKYGADKNASSTEKWAKALGRVAYNTAQGGLTGLVAGKGVGGLFGLGEGLIEGLAGLAMDGSQYGVKGGSYATQKGFDPNQEIAKMTPANIATNIAAGAAFSALGQKMLSPIISKISSKINAKPKKPKRAGNKAGEWYDLDANGAQNPAFWGLNENWEVPSVAPVIPKPTIASVPSIPNVFQEMGLDPAAQADFVARQKFNEYIDNFFKGNAPGWSIDQKNMQKPSKKFADFLKEERIALGLPESLPPKLGIQLPSIQAPQVVGQSKGIFAPEISAMDTLQQEFYRVAKESMPDLPEEDLRKFILHRSRVISEDITGQEFSDSFASIADLKNKFFATLPKDTDEKLVQSFIKIFDFLKTKKGILDTSELDIKTVSGSKRPSDVVDLQNTILKPSGGATSQYTRILRDTLDNVWYEKPGQAGEGERLSAVLKEVLIPKIARDLGVLAPEAKLGFRLGDLLSPVVLSRDFTPEGFQTLSSVMKSSPEKIQFSFSDFIKRFNTDRESTIKGIVENFGEVLGFQRVFGSTDHFGLNTFGNAGNSFVTPEGRIGLLDFGFSTPPTIAELDYLISSYKDAQSLVYDFLRLFGISDKQLDPVLKSPDGQDVSDLFTKSFFKGLYNISDNAQNMVRSSLFDQRLAELIQKSAGMTIGGDFRYIKDFIEVIATRKDEFAKRAGLYSKGGLVNNMKYFAAGGYARGTDTIPAMLSQGEYVIKKKAVDALGLDTMNKINQGQMPAGNTNSVYNYSLSVNVSNSNANPNDIARTVINQIRQIEGQRIRGNR